MVRHLIASLLMLPLFFLGCSREGRQSNAAVAELRILIQNEFPQNPAVPVPVNNTQTEDKVRLGEALFFDPNLSACGTVACASCHLPELGFSDGRRVSQGCGGTRGRRNSNSLVNVAYASHLFWDGRAQSLEQQALAPVADPSEMANRWDEVLHYLRSGQHRQTGKLFSESSRFYREYFERVFGGEISSTTVAKALASYQRTLVTYDAPFDHWLQGDDEALSAAQQRGLLIFFGRARCSQCHMPPHFTDSDFHNVAVPRAGFETAELFPLNRTIDGGIAVGVDPGRAEVESLRNSGFDAGRFKTPGLRNVELSSPYMHNGAFSSLDAVVQHYWSVGRGTATPLVGTLDEKARHIMLTDFGGHPTDIADLAEFLKALTGRRFQSPPGGIAPPSAP